jgi:hypothetical protein
MDKPWKAGRERTRLITFAYSGEEQPPRSGKMMLYSRDIAIHQSVTADFNSREFFFERAERECLWKQRIDVEKV